MDYEEEYNKKCNEVDELTDDVTSLQKRVADLEKGLEEVEDIAYRLK